MRVDGFRFDLATALTRDGLHDVNLEGGFISAIGQDPVLRNVKLISEPWDVGHNGYQVGAFPEPWSEWNDQFRDCVRDFWRGQSNGVAELGWRLTGSGDIYWDQIGGSHASVNFVTAHDGFTLHDLVSYNSKHNLNNGESNADGTDSNRSWNCGVEGATHDENIKSLRRRQMRNLLATTILSAGIPMILQGDEVGRTQRGNNNAYCQDNEISWQNWDLEPWQTDLRDFTKHIIALRQEHRVFQRSGYLSGEQVEFVDAPDIAWLTPEANLFSEGDWQNSQTRALGMYLAGAVSTLDGHNLVDSAFYWFLNSAAHEVEITLPGDALASSYRLMFDTVRDQDFFDDEDVAAGTKYQLAPWSSALWIVTTR
jgi:glycogen operon protein